ncbi:hypothetical protein ACFLVB_04660, partial [Chloroflexota bacterium]
SRSLAVKLTRSTDNNQNDDNRDYDDSTCKKTIILSHSKRIIKRQINKCKQTNLFIQTHCHKERVK